VGREKIVRASSELKPADGGPNRTERVLFPRDGGRTERESRSLCHQVQDISLLCCAARIHEASRGIRIGAAEEGGVGGRSNHERGGFVGSTGRQTDHGTMHLMWPVDDPSEPFR
jgi:hypothetical protein